MSMNCEYVIMIFRNLIACCESSHCVNKQIDYGDANVQKGENDDGKEMKIIG